MRIILLSAKMSFDISKRYPVNMLFSIMSSVFSFIPYLLIVIMFSDVSDDYIAWVTVGSAIWLVLSQLIWSIGMSTKSEIEEGTLEQLIISPANEVVVLAGKAMPSIGISLLTSITVLLVLAICSETRYFRVIEVIILLFCCVPMFVGSAILLSILVIKFKEVAAFFQVLMTCFTILFGIATPIQYLPYPLKVLSNILVVPQIVQYSREIFIDGRSLLEVEILKNIAFVTTIGIVVLIVSILLLKRMIENMKTKGSLLYV